MIVIFANAGEPFARILADRWSSHGAQLMTPADLSLDGWVWDGAQRIDASCVVNGKKRHPSSISGALIRATHVAPSDLGHLAEADRTYVAAEMTAFLIHWFTELDVPVFNRPSGGCLAGPGWHREHWAFMAARMGIRPRQIRRQVGGVGSQPTLPSDSAVMLTVVGDKVYGDASSQLADKASALARSANAELVRFGFSSSEPDACLLDADPFPAPVSEEVERAIVAALSAR